MNDERHYDYHVGDLVTIRYREDIPHNCFFGWNTKMEQWSGKIFMISDMIQYSSYETLVIFEDMPKEMQKWRWSTNMIRPAAVVEMHDGEILDLLQPLM